MYDGTGGVWLGWEIFLFVTLPLVTIFFIFLQVMLLNRGLERWDAMLEVPIMQSLWIIFCIIGAGVFFAEFSSFELWQYFIFQLGVIITIGDGGLLGYHRRKSSNKDTLKVNPSIKTKQSMLRLRI